MIVSNIEELLTAPSADAYIIYLRGKMIKMSESRRSAELAFKARVRPSLITIRLVNYVSNTIT